MREPFFLSVGETAHALGLGVTKTKVFIARGELRSIKVGARRLIHARDLEAFAERLRAEQAGATGGQRSEHHEGVTRTKYLANDVLQVDA